MDKLMNDFAWHINGANMRVVDIFVLWSWIEEMKKEKDNRKQQTAIEITKEIQTVVRYEYECGKISKEQKEAINEIVAKYSLS